MTDLQQYAPGAATTVQFFRLWSDRVDGLERHLSAHTGAKAVVIAVLILYPIARIAIPAILHGIVPEVVRSVLNLT